jgi:hypothetical protein
MWLQTPRKFSKHIYDKTDTVDESNRKGGEYDIREIYNEKFKKSASLKPWGGLTCGILPVDCI